MDITMAVNNAYYLDGLQDMAIAAGTDIPNLCTVIMTKAVEEYVESVKRFKRAAVRDLTESREVDGDA